jgi:E3 ubiquitin-protein ligase BRE1
MELNNKVAEMSSETGKAAIQKLQDEIKSCKSILKCSVCSDRPKEVSVLLCVLAYTFVILVSISS